MRISATTTEMMQNTCDWHVALVCSKRFYGVDVLHVNGRTFVSMKKQDGASASPCLVFFTVYQWGVFLERMRYAVLKCVFCFVSISESVDRSNEWVL